MTFEERDWKNIMNLKEAGVRWELVSSNGQAPSRSEVKENVSVSPIDMTNSMLSDLDKFEQAVKEGLVERRKAGWYYFGDTNIGRIDDAVKYWSEL